MKKITFLLLTFIFISCKNKSEDKSNQSLKNNESTSIFLKDSLIKSDISNLNKKPKKKQIEFLNFIDESLVFQESLTNDHSAYAFVCHGDKNEMKFSGKIYLIPSPLELNKWKKSDYREVIIDSINNIFSNKEIHEKFILWAQITHKDFFMPYNKLIDNPCEYYKKDRTVIIYKSAKGQEYWKEIEKTKNVARLEEILK